MHWYAGHLEKEIILVTSKYGSCETFNVLIKHGIPENFLNAQKK